VRIDAGAQATPIPHRASGRHFSVIPAGGNTSIKSGLGDSIIAYALPMRSD
jgi:glucose dehydrogenase